MMTEIHAKPSKSSRTDPPDPPSSSGTGADGAGKKRPIDKSGAGPGVEKKKKEKKKALKRL